jgi:hypothetical protein
MVHVIRFNLKLQKLFQNQMIDIYTEDNLVP